MPTTIYADHAATTPLSTAAYNAMLPYLTHHYGNASQHYALSRPPRRAIDEARQTIAQCIGARPEEILFTSGGTESDNTVIHSAVQRQADIITTTIEHHAILYPCRAAEKYCHVTYLPVTNYGVVDMSVLRTMSIRRGSLVSVMLANNELGTIQPLADIADIAHENHALCHTDAVQAVGHIPIDVDALHVDYLSASAHKFNGPKGIGFLYHRTGAPLTPLLLGGAQEGGLRAGTENVAAIVGMAAALKENVDNLDKNIRHLQQLEQIVLTTLNDLHVPYTLHTTANHLPGLISLAIHGTHAEQLMHRLDLCGITLATGAACNSTTTTISHVLTAINLPMDLAVATIRVSLGSDNTPSHAARLAHHIATIAHSTTP